eukprot:scaffold620_cov169-Amphora_coffeaeformis.AAC.22
MTPAHHNKDNNRRRTVMGLEAFARGGTPGKAIAAFRDRKERKRRHTAQALRQYTKVMHQEGYTPGQGASRKRRPEREESNEKDTTTTDRLDTKHNKTSSSSSNNDNAKPAPRTRRHKTNPHKDLQPKAAPDNNTTIKTKEAQEKERKQKLRERRQRTRRMQQRTSKGQPIMKHLKRNNNNSDRRRRRVFPKNHSSHGGREKGSNILGIQVAAVVLRNFFTGKM